MAGFFKHKPGRITIGGGKGLNGLLQSVIVLIFWGPGEERPNIPPGIFKKPANVLKKESYTQGACNDHLDHVTSAAGIDI